MKTEDLNPPDALRWLFAELNHIRHIHFILLVLSSLTIIVTLVGYSALTSALYIELEDFRDFAKRLSSEMDSREFFPKRIKNYLQSNESLFDCIPEEQAIKLDLIKITLLKIDNLSQPLSVIREKIEQIEVKATIISEIELKGEEVLSYLKFRTTAKRLNLLQTCHATVVDWPSTGKGGKIEFTMGAKHFGIVEPQGKFPLGKLTSIEHKASATFLIKKERWQIDANWFNEKFRNLAKDWHEYEDKTIDDLFKETKRNLTKNLQDVNLPLGITVPAQYAVLFLPILMILTSLVLAIEVSHIADFVQFYKQTWEQPIACLLSPWIGGRNQWYRIWILIITLIILPGLATTYLMLSFPILGVKESYFLGFFIFIIYLVIGSIIINKGKHITHISFKRIKLKT